MRVLCNGMHLNGVSAQDSSVQVCLIICLRLDTALQLAMHEEKAL